MTPPLTWVGTSWKMTCTVAESRACARVLRREVREHGSPPGVRLFVLPAHTALAAVADVLVAYEPVWAIGTAGRATLGVPGVDGLFVGRAAWEPQGLLTIARTRPPTPPHDTPGGSR